MRLIVTRPEPDAARTADALLRLGHEPIVSPALDIRFDGGAALPRKLFQAVLATSSNAVRGLARHPDRAPLAEVPLLAVGDQTALEAKRAGFRFARSAGGALADLVALVERDLDPRAGPLLYPCGDVLAGDLAGLLAERGFEVDAVVVYISEPRARLTSAAEAALRRGDVDGVLLYSPRSAAAFLAAAKAAGLLPLPERLACFCLSRAVADELDGMTDGPVRCAERPDQISLFAAIEEHARKVRGAGTG